MFKAEWFEGVEQYDIKVTRQAAMLEAVVENKHIRMELRNCLPRRRNAVAILQVRHIRQGLRQFAGFVVLLASWRRRMPRLRSTTLAPRLLQAACQAISRLAFCRCRRVSGCRR